MGTLELVKSILNGEKISEEEIEKSNPYYYLQERNHGRFGRLLLAPDMGSGGLSNKKSSSPGGTIESVDASSVDDISKDSQTTSERQASQHVTLTEELSQYSIKRLKKFNAMNKNAVDFLNYLKTAFLFNNTKQGTSCYIHKKTQFGESVLRISDHSGNTIYTQKRQNVISIVVKILNNKFKKNKGVYREYVYKPKNLTPEKMTNIVDGIKNWVNTQNYTYQQADEINSSENNSTNKSIKNTEVEINIKDVTVGNRQAKIDCLEKSFTDKLNYGKALVEYVEKDDTPVLKDLITLRIARFDKGKIDKAVRTLSFSLDTELKAPKGEAFTYKAQEDLTNLFVKELTEKTKELYTMLVAYFGLPEMRILTKANLVYKGKVVYSPETGKPISEKDWAKFVDALEKFLNRNYKGIGKRIVLSADALGRILDRLTDTKKLEEIKKLRLDELKYKGKKLEWISDSVKNMSNTFGESLSRIQQAKIQVMTQSAAQRITKVTDGMRNDIQQILIDGVKNHQSKSQVSQALFDKCVGLNRDFQRIADTEIHNAATEAYINEEVYKTPEGKKVYFKRFEILDGNTCKKCSSIDGMIALYSDTPLSSQKIVDDYAEIAIWEGCGILNDKEIPMSGCHPYCRGAWIRYYPETEKEVKEMM